MFNKILLILVTSSIASSPTILFASAKSINKTNENNNIILKEPHIVDFQATMTEAFKTAYQYMHPVDFKDFVGIKLLQFLNQKETNISANLVGKPILQSYDKKFNFIAHDILKNRLNKEIVLDSQSYKTKLSNEISSRTDTGLSLNLTTQVLETFGIDTNFSFNNSKNTKEVTEAEYSIPQQHIPVPAHKQVEVDAYWSQSKMVEKVSLDVDISGSLRGIIILKNYYQEFDISFSNAIFYLSFAKKCPEGVSFNSVNNTVHFAGKAESWNSSVGNEYTVDVSAPENITD